MWYRGISVTGEAFKGGPLWHRPVIWLPLSLYEQKQRILLGTWKLLISCSEICFKNFSLTQNRHPAALSIFSLSLPTAFLFISGVFHKQVIKVYLKRKYTFHYCLQIHIKVQLLPASLVNSFSLLIWNSRCQKKNSSPNVYIKYLSVCNIIFWFKIPSCFYICTVHVFSSSYFPWTCNLKVLKMQPPQSGSALWLTEASDPPGDEPAWEDNKSHKLQIIVIIIRSGNFL